MEINLKTSSSFKFKTKPNSKKDLDLVMKILLVFLIVAVTVSVAYATTSGNMITGFEQFDDMYRYYSDQDKPFVDDIMKPVNTIVFNIIDFVGQFIGSFLLMICVVSAGFAIWYAAKPEFADEVSEVKQRVASGEIIPIDEIKPFLLQFFPDIKANSGLASEYEYERPTLGLFVRDHLAKFIVLFAVAIMLQQNILVAFIVKSATAVSYAGQYYTENTDFVGIVNTWTTAGKDYKPGYDTLTTEGKNKKKLYNAMYSAIKREYPRNRTEEFLQQVGLAVHNKVVKLSEDSGLNLSSQNFSATAEVILSQMAYDESAVNFRTEFNVSQFVTLAPGEQDKILHVNVLQYDIIEQDGTSSGIPSTTSLSKAWKLPSNGGTPTSLEVHNQLSEHINNTNDPYRFQYHSGAPEVTFTVRYSDGSVDIVKAKGQVTTTKYTINMSNVTSAIDKKVGNGTILVRYITVEGVNKGITLVNSKGQSQPVPGSGTWRR